jgi:hypothetical protein
VVSDLIGREGGQVTKPFASRQPRLWLIILIVTIPFLTVCLGYFRFFTNADKKSPSVASPPIPVVSVCKELPPGMRRIGAKPGDRYMLQFDVRETEALIREGGSDAPPIVYGFGIKPKGSESRLWISYGSQRHDVAADRARESSSQVVKRIIVDDKGHSVGEDDWGYQDTEKRWRRTRLQGWVTAEYGLVNEQEAKLFDRVLSSACLPSH